MTDFGLHPGLHEPLKPASEPRSETKEKAARLTLTALCSSGATRNRNLTISG